MTTPRYDLKLLRLEPRARFETSGPLAEVAGALLAAGIPVPQRHNSSCTTESGIRIDWLGPRRFVVSAAYHREMELGRVLQVAFADFACADVTCSTDMVVTFQLLGSGAAEVLAQATPLDTASAAFGPGSATGTDLWGVAAVIERPAEAPDCLTVTVDRSVADYVEGWLMTAAGLASDFMPGVMQTSAASALAARRVQP